MLQSGVPAFTVPQPDEAMRILDEKASKLDVMGWLYTKTIDDI